VKNYKIVVVNDQSTDKTASIASKIIGSKRNVKLLHTPALPEGWVGKNHACHRGVMNEKSDYFCFIDADTRPSEHLMSASMIHCLKNNVDVFSVSPMHDMKSVSERLFLPGIFLAVSNSLNIRKMNSKKSKKGITNGQFIMFKRESYEAIGGHEGVKNIFAEDIALGQLAKEAGLNLNFVVTNKNIFSVRMYTGFRSIWEGFAKNMNDITHAKTPLRVFLHVLKSISQSLFPILLPALAYAGITEWGYNIETVLFFMAAYGSLLSFGVYFGMVFEFGLPLYYAFAFPLGLLVHSGLVVQSYWNDKTGRKSWKGRSYDHGSVIRS